jgi:hypothetical protein
MRKYVAALHGVQWVVSCQGAVATPAVCGWLLQFAAGVTLRPNSKYFGQHQSFHGMTG